MEIPHELMHALDLEHTFDTKNTHTFKEGSTQNYMDYDNTKETTFKWQWRARNLLTKRVFTEN